jgi:hypothetical protein
MHDDEPKHYIGWNEFLLIVLIVAFVTPFIITHCG